MVKIHMDTDQVEGMIKTIQGAATGMQNVALGMDQVCGDLSLAWSGGSANEFRQEVAAGKKQIDYLLDQTRILANRASNEVAEWLQMDTRSVQSFRDCATTKTLAPGATLFLQGDGDHGEIDINDVSQGGLGDCYMIASLAAVAQQNPDLIKKMIRDNGDGSYTVTFYEKNQFIGIETPGFTKKEITVKLDGSEYAEFGDSTDQNQEVWVRVIEKGYAEWKGGYSAIEGGWPHNALEAITGIDSVNYTPSSLKIDDLASALKSGGAVTAGTFRDVTLGPIDLPDITDSSSYYTNNQLIQGHAYTVTAVDSAAGTVTVRNPWGGSNAYFTLPFADFQKNFSTVQANTLAP